MNSGETKYLLNAFQKMLSQHPELCPHDYVKYDSNYKTRLNKFRCKICGDDMAKPMTKEDIDCCNKTKNIRQGGKHGKNTSK